VRRILGLALSLALLSAPALACDIEHAPSSHWSVVRENAVAWLETPCGERFYSLGVNILDGGYEARERSGKTYYNWKAFAPTLDAWIGETRNRLAEWGFNSAGGWSLQPDLLKLPAVINLEVGRRAKFHWFDPFSPDTERRMNELARELVAPYRGSHHRPCKGSARFPLRSGHGRFRWRGHGYPSQTGARPSLRPSMPPMGQTKPRRAADGGAWTCPQAAGYALPGPAH